MEISMRPTYSNHFWCITISFLVSNIYIAFSANGILMLSILDRSLHLSKKYYQTKQFRIKWEKCFCIIAYFLYIFCNHKFKLVTFGGRERVCKSVRTNSTFAILKPIVPNPHSNPFTHGATYY